MIVYSDRKLSGAVAFGCFEPVTRQGRQISQAGGTNYLTDTRNAQEVNFTTQGSTAEVESGGPVMNIVPRTGGNTFSGNLALVNSGSGNDITVTYSQAATLTLGNVAVPGGNLSVTTSNALAEAAGAKVNVSGTTLFNATGGAITFSNSGNTFTGAVT